MKKEVSKTSKRDASPIKYIEILIYNNKQISTWIRRDLVLMEWDAPATGQSRKLRSKWALMRLSVS